ncbi:MAG: hypothetical protein LUQ71_10315 [Methanoregula sp.]|nr:hypothetical protein [Methanoregula sp.]
MAVTIQQVRSRIGDPSEKDADPIFDDDDIALAISEAADILLNKYKVPIDGPQGERAVRTKACIDKKNDLISRILASSMGEGSNSIQIRDAEAAVVLWQKDLDEYISSHRGCPLSVI